MRLTALRINTLPGLEHLVEIARFGPGVNVVLGPNASGKSSLIRALLAILYPGEQDDEIVDAQAELVDPHGVAYSARRLGKVVSWESGGSQVEPPRLPPGHLIGTYVLRLEDLLGPADDESKGKRGNGARAERERLDAHIAQRLDKELSGGIDLKAVRRAIGTQAEKGQKLAAELRAATAAHAELRRSRAELHRQEAKLAGAKSELARSLTGAARKHLIADANRLLGASLERDTVVAELAAYPAHLGDLLGNEADEFVKAHSAMAQCEHDRKRLDMLAARAAESLAELGLPVHLSVATAELNLDLAESLVTASEQLSSKEREIAGLRVRHGEALRRLGGPLPAGSTGVTSSAQLPVIRLDAETLEKIERLLDQRQAARAELHERRRQLEEISRLVEPAEGEDGLLDVSAGVYRGGRTMDGMAAPLRGIRYELVRWLQEPLREPRRPDWAWAIALGLAVVTVAAAGAGAPSGWLAGLSGATAIWLGVTRLALQPPRSAVTARIEADVAARQDATDITLPDEWSHSSVIDMILDIDDEIARRETSEREAERYDERLRQLTGDSRLAQQRLQGLQAELEAMRDQVGFGVAPDISLTLWLQAAREVEATRALLDGATAEFSRHSLEAAALTKRLTHFLLQDGAPPTAAEPGLADPTVIRARCRELLRRAQARDTLLVEQDGLRRERKRLDAEAQGQLSRLTDILARARLPVDPAAGLDAAQHELSALVARLPAWRDARERLRAKEALIDELSSRVSYDQELLAAALAHDHAGLEAAAVLAEQASERAQELSRDIHRTERDVENASSERRLQQAAAGVRAATDELLAHRQVASELAAAEFMLDTVEAEHEAGSRPAALERAAGWFARFTHDDFALTFEPGVGGSGGRRLGARDVGSGRALDLTELSTGTRSQLLLASRLAFALESEEASLPLPFFLDEALTTSDAQRFREVASAVISVAKADCRQFIYLSARGDDAQLWRQVAAEHDVEVEVIESLNPVA
ncbi:MAG TPA: hypothetical protein VFD39_06670 [Trueperaceae bacterium]|nr:hypothetical protein [Trueperaceae bacterium]